MNTENKKQWVSPEIVFDAISETEGGFKPMGPEGPTWIS